MSDVIHNPDLARDMAEHNFELGTKYFSFDTLKKKLEELISMALKAAETSA
jgi:alkylhydroperoxidase/carboxymuconolactone decarboxylase family protein YurZ